MPSKLTHFLHQISRHPNRMTDNLWVISLVISECCSATLVGRGIPRVTIKAILATSLPGEHTPGSGCPAGPGPRPAAVSVRGLRPRLTGSRVSALVSSAASFREAVGVARSLATEYQKVLQPLRMAASRRPQSLAGGGEPAPRGSLLAMVAGSARHRGRTGSPAARPPPPPRWYDPGWSVGQGSRPRWPGMTHPVSPNPPTLHILRVPPCLCASPQGPGS